MNLFQLVNPLLIGAQAFAFRGRAGSLLGALAPVGSPAPRGKQVPAAERNGQTINAHVFSTTLKIFPVCKRNSYIKIVGATF